MKNGVALLMIVATLSAVAADRPRPGWLGMGVAYHAPAQSKGGIAGWIYVMQLAPGGPALAAGVRPQDVITAIDGRPLRFADETAMLASLASVRPNQRLTFDVRRGASTLRIAVTATPMSDAMYRLWRQNVPAADHRPPPR